MIPPDFTIPKAPEAASVAPEATYVAPDVTQEGAESNPAPVAAPKKVGRPANPNKPVGVTVYLTPGEWEYLNTWNPTNASFAARELIEDLKRIRPEGRHSAPKGNQAGKLAPGSKTMLKRELKAERLRADKLAARVAKLEELLTKAKGGGA